MIWNELRKLKQRLLPSPTLRICSSCYALFGDCGQPSPQRCRCTRPNPDETWPRYDFNTAVELCRCCGLELLRSGSRWSVWFCADCKRRVLEMNRAAGRCVVPIGRHSFHAGLFLRADDVHRPGEVMAFVEGVTAISQATEALTDWASSVVASNLDAVGLYPAPEGALLADYLRAVRSTAPASKRQRFREMIEFLVECSTA